jgi:hypothetical protein
MNVLHIQEELKRYRELCLAYRYSPAQKEFEDIVQFILLHSGNGISESIQIENNSTIEYLFENFKEELDLLITEAQYEEPDTEGNFDTTVGLVHGYAKKGVMAVVGAAALAGLYINYLFKKGKLKAAMSQEHQLEMSKLDLYDKVISIGVKLAKMKGETQPKLTDLTQPALTDTPSMPNNPKEESK